MRSSKRVRYQNVIVKNIESTLVCDSVPGVLTVLYTRLCQEDQGASNGDFPNRIHILFCITAGRKCRVPVGNILLHYCSVVTAHISEKLDSYNSVFSLFQLFTLLTYSLIVTLFNVKESSISKWEKNLKLC